MEVRRTGGLRRLWDQCPFERITIPFTSVSQTAGRNCSIITWRADNNSMKTSRDTQGVWRGLEPTFFYSHRQEKVVVALVSGALEVQAVTPFETRLKGPSQDLAQITAPVPETPGALPSLPEAIRARASSGSALLLFPTHPDDVSLVAAAWFAVLDGERWFGPAKEEGHLSFVSFEVGDDRSTYARFLRAEQALWQSLHHFHPSPTTEYHLQVVDEALELGEVVTTRFFGAGQRSYHVAQQALCDTAARTLVLEKRDGMRALAHETGG